jgi:peptidoglycan/xylan/chitin deacetylase (PgdA/CDA1 family)
MFSKKLPVLMYHQVISNGSPDNLCITANEIEKHLQYICNKGYNCITVQQLIDHHYQNASLPGKPILLTFDDGYRNNFTNLYPLLLKYNLRATIFLNPFYILQNAEEGKTILSVEEIQQVDTKHIEWGLHTYKHQSYNDLSLKEIVVDIKEIIDWFNEQQISFVPAHAYTYGAFPKKDAAKQAAIVDIFSASGIQLAFRIGNRLNKLPLKSPFKVQRIDILGTDGFGKFKRKLKYGAKYLLF